MAVTIEDVESRTLLQQFHSLYEKEQETEQELENKQDKLTAGTNITIDENNVISANSTSITVDDEISSISENPVQNKVIYNALGTKQNVIDASHKLDADNVDDTTSTNKFVTASDKTTWNGKQDTLTAGTNITIDANNVISASGGLQEVKASDVDSETATNGQVLTADGNGGASWQDASGGDKWYEHYLHLSFASTANIWTCNARIITKSPTSFTSSLLATYINTYGYVGILDAKDKVLSTNKKRVNTPLYIRSTGSDITVDYKYKTFTINGSDIEISCDTSNLVPTLSDTVTEL